MRAAADHLNSRLTADCSPSSEPVLVGVAVLTQSGPLRSKAFLSALIAVLTASSFLGYGVVDAWQERRATRPVLDAV